MTTFPNDQPPAFGDQGLLPKTSSWPNVLGIFGIVIAALGILTNICGVISSLAQGAINKLAFSSTGPNVPAGMAEYQQRLIDVQSKYQIPSAVLAVIGLALAGWLLWGSILMVKRKRGCLSLVYWAPISMIVTVAGAVLMFFTQQDMATVMQAMPGAKGSPMNMSGFMAGIGIVSVVLHLLMRWPLPIVMLAFLAVGKRREEAQSWPN